MAWLHTVIAVPTGLHAPTANFWQRALGWPLGDPWPGHPEPRSFEPGDGVPYVHLRQIEGLPRVHVGVECQEPKADIEVAVSGGAEVAGRSERWVALQSPGGLPFCLVTANGHAAPEPVAWPSGHRSRLVQVCIDSPPARHDDEVAFWRGLLGARWAAYSSAELAEFAGKWHDDAGSPLQLLFQRLDNADGEVRAGFQRGWGSRDGASVGAAARTAGAAGQGEPS